MNIIRRIILSTGELPKNISQNLSVDISGMDAGALLREQEATLFYLEEWETLEQLWHHGKGQLFTSFVIGIPQRLEHIILMNLLLGRDLEEPLEMFRKLKKQYPLMITSVKRIERRVALFISLRKGEMAHCVNDFEYFLTTDQTESEFDKAFAAELFARIAIKYGHHPSKLSSLVKRSLNAYARLKLPKRVVLTAERFLECKLVSKKEYEGILRKYGEKSINEGDAAEEVVEVSQSTADSADEVQEGVYLNCFGRVTVTLSDGKEMVRKYWGKRKKAPSHQRRIIIELVCARYLGKKISRRELLELFYPNVGWNRLSKKRREVYETWLSIRLSQLRRIFSPFFVIERSEGGYILSSSVQTDLFDIRSSLKRAQMLKAQHRPSALWICKKALRKISRGEFAEGVQTERVKKIRKEIREIHQELQLFAASLERDIAHHAS